MDLHIVLVAPEIPQNTGAIGRVCVGLDAHLHLVEPLGFDLDEKKLRRAGMDYWPHVKLSRHENWAAFMEQESPALENMFFSTAKTDRSCFDVTYPETSYLILGSESKGLPGTFHKTYKDQLITIPMPGEHSRSHNIANACSVMAYEAYRQLR